MHPAASWYDTEEIWYLVSYTDGRPPLAISNVWLLELRWVWVLYIADQMSPFECICQFLHFWIRHQRQIVRSPALYSSLAKELPQTPQSLASLVCEWGYDTIWRQTLLEAAYFKSKMGDRNMVPLWLLDRVLCNPQHLHRWQRAGQQGWEKPNKLLGR